MSIALVQNNKSTGTGSSLTPTFSNTPTSGNMLVLISGSSIGTVSSVTSTGATWTQAVQENSVQDIEIWYAPNISSAGTVITVNYSGSIVAAAMIAEFSGLITVPLDKRATNVGSGTALDSGTTAIISESFELCIAGFLGVSISNCSLSTPTNGYTLQDQENPTHQACGWSYLITSSQTTQDTGVTISTSATNWVGAIATFLSSAVVPANQGIVIQGQQTNIIVKTEMIVI
jgi:hypothetical protein